MLIKYHGNGLETPFVKWEFEEITNVLRLEREAAAESGWKELVRTPGNRKRCILIIATAIFSQCSGNSLGKLCPSCILCPLHVSSEHLRLISDQFRIISFRY